MSVNPIEPVVPDGGQTPPNTDPDPTQNALWKKANGDWEKASSSYFNAVKELGSTHDQLAGERQRAAQLEAMLMAAVGGKAPANQDNPFAELEALGISSAGMDKALENKANAIVEKQMQALFGPIVNQMQAEETLASEIEDFDQHKAEARTFMKANPEVAEVFKELVVAKPVAAWKYAIRETAIAKQSKLPRNLPPGLPGGRTPVGRGVPGVDAAEQLKRETDAAQLISQYGDPRPYRHERFKGTSIERAVNAQLQRMGLAPPTE